MPLHFDKNAEKGNQFLNELARKLGDPDDTHKAGRVLRAVLRVLRMHLTTTEGFQFLAQLPMALKAVYVDGWMPGKKREKGKSRDDFLAKVVAENLPSSRYDFKNKADTLRQVRMVFFVLGKYISAGEFRNMEAVLPESMKPLLQNIHKKKTEKIKSIK